MRSGEPPGEAASAPPLFAPTAPWPAFVLSIAGLLPAFALLYSLQTGRGLPGDTAEKLFVAYAGATLAHLGGVQWGEASSLAVTRLRAGWLRFGASVLPVVIVTLAWLAPLSGALVMLAAAHGALVVFDVVTARLDGQSMWYARLRMWLGTAMIICLLTPVVQPTIASL